MVQFELTEYVWPHFIALFDPYEGKQLQGGQKWKTVKISPPVTFPPGIFEKF